MVLEHKERQTQADFYEISGAIDIPGSVALNARQPSLAAVADSTAAQASTPPDKQPAQANAASETSGSASRTEISSPKKTQVAHASAGTEVELDKCGATGVDRNSGVQASPMAAQDGESVQHSSTPPSAAPFAACELATLQQLLRTKSGNMALVSDVDEQLLLNISFKQPVRVTSFSILASTPPTGFSTNCDEDDSVSGPMLVKVYCNKNCLNFCGVADEACEFSVMLSHEDVLRERRIALPGSKFQMCTSMQIFVQENLGGSAYTFLNKLALFGIAHKRYS